LLLVYDINLKLYIIRNKESIEFMDFGKGELVAAGTAIGIITMYEIVSQIMEWKKYLKFKDDQNIKDKIIWNLKQATEVTTSILWIASTIVLASLRMTYIIWIILLFLIFGLLAYFTVYIYLNKKESH
jgi:hypothetical protein